MYNIITHTLSLSNDCAPFQVIVLWLKFYSVVVLLWCRVSSWHLQRHVAGANKFHCECKHNEVPSSDIT